MSSALDSTESRLLGTARFAGAVAEVDGFSLIESPQPGAAAASAAKPAIIKNDLTKSTLTSHSGASCDLGGNLPGFGPTQAAGPSPRTLATHR
jgi:hypothetical protein